MEENKNYCSREDDEIEVNLRLMFYNGLKNWRKLLLAGLLVRLNVRKHKALHRCLLP